MPLSGNRKLTEKKTVNDERVTEELWKSLRSTKVLFESWPKVRYASTRTSSSIIWDPASLQTCVVYPPTPGGWAFVALLIVPRKLLPMQT